jgi:hypothetical protein
MNYLTKMKFNIFVLLIVLFIPTTFSCKKEKVKGCMNKEAANYDSNAQEDNGLCSFERDKFLGNWIGVYANTNNSGLPDTIVDYSFSITPNTNITSDVNMSSFPVSNANCRANVNSNNRFQLIIPKQIIITTADSFGISGSGQISENAIVFILKKESLVIIDTIAIYANK